MQRTLYQGGNGGWHRSRDVEACYAAGDQSLPQLQMPSKETSPKKSSVSLSQKSIFLPITFDEQESPGVPNTIPDGQLLLMTLGSYSPWSEWDGRVWEAHCCWMKRGRGEGKGFVNKTCLGESLGKVLQPIRDCLETGGEARGRLFVFGCVTAHNVRF